MRLGMTMRRGALAIAAAALLLTLTPTTAGAGTFKTTAKWKNCDTAKSAISIKATFTNPARYYGKGRYMVKRWVEWEVYKGSAGWREEDRKYTESNWLQINNPQYDYVTTAADRTGWANLYYSHWRAKVTIKLIKNRKGPRDKKVEEIQIFPTKGSFQEKGSNCGVSF